MKEILSGKILHPLLQIKLNAYQLIVFYLLSFIVPGTLILFYFYRNYFDSYDLTRLFLLIIAISTPFVVIAIHSLLGMLYSSIKGLADVCNEDDDIRAILLQVLLANSLLGCFISLFVCYLLKSHSIMLFAMNYIALVFVFYKFLLYSMKQDIKKAEREAKQNSKEP